MMSELQQAILETVRLLNQLDVQEDRILFFSKTMIAKGLEVGVLIEKDNKTYYPAFGAEVIEQKELLNE